MSKNKEEIESLKRELEDLNIIRNIKNNIIKELYTVKCDIPVNRDRSWTHRGSRF